MNKRISSLILFVFTTSVKAISSMEDNRLGLEKNISNGNATQGNRGERNIPIFNVISFPNRLGDYKLIAVQLNCVTQLKLNTGYKLSSPIFCCL